MITPSNATEIHVSQSVTEKRERKIPLQEAYYIEQHCLLNVEVLFSVMGF
jgi:hypothetical protein